MLNIFPIEIVYNILVFVNIKTYSKILLLNKKHYNSFNPSKWNIIDNMKFANHPIPLNYNTYNNYKYNIDWITIIYNKTTIPESVIEIFMIKDKSDNDDISKFNIKLILKYQKLSHDFLLRFYQLCDWKILLSHQNLPQSLIEKIISENELDPIDWYNLLSTQKYNLEFINNNIERINWHWHAVSINKDVITTDILSKYYDNLIWPELTKHGINQDIIEIFIYKLDPISWSNVAYYSQLSNSFILKYISFLNPQILFRTQQLDHTTIIYLVNLQKDIFDIEESWVNIALYQSLDFNFIYTYKNNLSLKYLIRNPKIKRKDLYLIYDKN